MLAGEAAELLDQSSCLWYAHNVPNSMLHLLICKDCRKVTARGAASCSPLVRAVSGRMWDYLFASSLKEAWESEVSIPL